MFMYVFLYISIMFSYALNAQPVAQDVLDDVLISSSEYAGIIKIKFRMPVRYLSHYPKQLGREIRVQVDVVNILKNSSSGNERESITPQERKRFGLDEVVYEKEGKSHYLTLFFNKEVSFEVIQDASYRSLTFVIHDTQ
jgi:hypothetical protein